MKLIFKWDSQFIFSGTKFVEDDYKLANNETFAPIPQPNLMPVKRAGSAWQSATQEEHDAYVKQQQALYPQHNQPVEPSAQDKLNAQLTLDNAKQAQVNANQAKLNAQLTLDIAQLKKQLQSNSAQAQA